MTGWLMVVVAIPVVAGLAVLLLERFGGDTVYTISAADLPNIAAPLEEKQEPAAVPAEQERWAA